MVLGILGLSGERFNHNHSYPGGEKTKDNLQYKMDMGDRVGCSII